MLKQLLLFIIEIIVVLLYFKFFLLKHMTKPTDKKVEKGLLKRLLIYFNPYYKQYLVAILLLVIQVLLNVLTPYLIGQTLKELGYDEINFNNIILYFVLGLTSIIIAGLFSYLNRLMLFKIGQKITIKIRNEAFDHLQTLSHQQIHDIPTGTLVTRVTSDCNQLNNFLAGMLLTMLQNILTVIVVIVAMFILNAKLAMLILLATPLLVALTLTFRTVVRNVHRNVRTEVSNMNAFLSENITGMKITQIYNQEEKQYKAFDKQNKKLESKSLKEIFTFSIFRPSIYFVYICSVILILYFGANLNLQNDFIGVISYYNLFVFYQYISRFFNPIQSLADQYNEIQSCLAAAEKIFAIMDIEPEIVDEPDAIDIDLIGEIEFRDVWFAYNNEDWIIKGISFKIEPGKAIAFVGATGAGKTTILKLITRCYDIQKGQILIDGHDIKHIRIQSLRKQIGQMLQDVFLFSGTIAENIRLSETSISDKDIYSACEEVNALAFINKFPEGIEQEVLERGNNFSMGERQLISFARTIAHKPKLIILDEATANIDTETELIIQDSLNNIIQNNTTIMVAHRLSTIQKADCIYVFERGVILERGTHQELLKKHGRYYKLYMLQFERTS